jgi:serine/threonine protein kinase/tetratricopeptide (TPR) repeat protein
MALEQDGSTKTELPDVLPRGAAIGRYVVLGLVGRGGMGDVYAAYDPELDRKVAVKLLRARSSAGQSTSEGRTRLLREAQAIAKLSHPNVITVYDVGTFKDVVFIAMEFIDGDTVRYWLNAAARTWQEVLRVFIAAGHGLAAAHEAEIVHRDFKPDNVMVRRDGKVRVMDFGLARQANADEIAPSSRDAAELTGLKSSGDNRILVPEPDSNAVPVAVPVSKQVHVDIDETRVLPPPNLTGSSLGTSTRKTPRDMLDGHSVSPNALETSLTQTGAMLGTPAYMAPEQFASKAGDARTDQFSYCVALYESLYGERPFEGKSFMALMTSVARGIVRDPPAGAKVPTWIRRILVRGLSSTAEARFPSMNALLHALEHDPSVVHRRWAMGGASAVLAGALIFGAARSLQARHSPCDSGAAKLAGIWELDATPSARKNAIHSAFAATGKSYAERAFDTVRKTLDKYVERWTATYTDACEATAVRGEQSAEVLDLRMSCLQGRLESIRALTDVFSKADGSTVEKAASAADGLPDLERCSNISVLRSVVKPPDDPTTRSRVEQLKPRIARLTALTAAGHYAEARNLTPSLVAEVRQVGYLPLVAQALRLRAGVITADLAQSETLAEEAVWAAQAGGDDEIVAETAMFLSYITAFQQENPKKGRLWLQLAEATLNRLGGHELMRSWLFNDRGLLAEVEGRYQDAVDAQRQAVALKEKILGREHPDVATSLENWATALVKQNRISEALEVSTRAVRITEKSLGSSHPDASYVFVTHAEILNAAGRFTEADGLARSALDAVEREVGSNDPLVAWASVTLGRSLVERGMNQEARSLLERALSIDTHTHRDVARRAEIAFLLARVLWSHRPERQRAVTLALEAKRDYADSTNEQALSNVERWLRDHDAL